MNRTLMIIGGCFTALALIATAHLFETEDPQPAALAVAQPAALPDQTAEPLTVDEIVQALSPGVEEGDLGSRLAALGELIEELQSPAFSRDPFSPESSERLVMAVEGVLVWPPEEDIPKVIPQAVDLIVSRTSSPASEAFASRLILEGSGPLRAAVLRKVGTRGGLRSGEIYDLLLDLNEKGDLPYRELPEALRRLGGRKAFAPIQELFWSSDDPAMIAHCAVSLQNYHRTEVMEEILERLDETGILSKRGLMPWIDRKAFGRFLKEAREDSVVRGLKAIGTRPSLIRGSLPVVERELESADPAVRRIAAAAIKKAVARRIIAAEKGEELLAGRLERETEPVLRAELTGGLSLAREFLRSQGEPVQP